MTPRLAFSLVCLAAGGALTLMTAATPPVPGWRVPLPAITVILFSLAWITMPGITRR